MTNRGQQRDDKWAKRKDFNKYQNKAIHLHQHTNHHNKLNKGVIKRVTEWEWETKREKERKKEAQLA